MNYENYYFGMNFIWWVIWVILIFWIFAIPYDIPGQKNPKDKPFEILKKRFASGEINSEEFEEMKNNLENFK